MAYKVFVSYSTNDFPIVEHVRRLIASPEVDVFIAEYSVTPSQPLDENIVLAIKTCDLFVLLWSRNSKASEWVPQEIGIARGNDKTILPIVLEEDLSLPAFIRDLKYLPAYGNPSESFIWLQQNILARAQKQQQNNALVLLGLSVSLVWLFSQK
ncbi:MAG: toll/interleukin-1 receptor domain-containing protein [Bacteroidota bacterium]